jgi:ABC-type branched-subunit amino acid transport system ATPase component
MSALLEIRELSRSFGGIRAVDSLSFDVERGGITGLIGPNGAGKTTVFNLITGVYSPDAASAVRLNGENLVGKRPYEIVRAGVSRTFQNIRLFNRMTCLQNVMTPLLVRGSTGPLAALFRTSRAREEEARAGETALVLLDKMGLAKSADRVASTLPYGLQRKLEIARALACMSPVDAAHASQSKARLLLLDEPAAGMNDSETRELSETIARVRNDFDVTILLIEHHISLVMAISTHIVVLDRGTLLAEGTPQAIRNDERVVTAYLGRPRERRKRA